MKEFPSILNVANKDEFPDIQYNRVLCYLRKNIYEHVIREDENSYFDLEKFQKIQKITVENRDKMATTVIEELVVLGWKCKLSYGSTALFIYSSENPPASCWDDGF